MKAKETLEKFKVRRIKELTAPTGDKFWIQSITELERAEFNESMFNEKNEINSKEASAATRKLIVRCLVEEDGTSVYLPGQENELENVDSLITMFLREEIDDHCGLQPKTVDLSKKS